MSVAGSFFFGGDAHSFAFQHVPITAYPLVRPRAAAVSCTPSHLHCLRREARAAASCGTAPRASCVATWPRSTTAPAKTRSATAARRPRPRTARTLVCWQRQAFPCTGSLAARSEHTWLRLKPCHGHSLAWTSRDHALLLATVLAAASSPCRTCRCSTCSCAPWLPDSRQSRRVHNAARLSCVALHSHCRRCTARPPPQVFPDASHIDFTLGVGDELITHVLGELDRLPPPPTHARAVWRSPSLGSAAAPVVEPEEPPPPLPKLCGADARDLAAVVHEAIRRAAVRAACLPGPCGGGASARGRPVAACTADFPWLASWTHRHRAAAGLDAEAAEGFD